MLARMVFVVCLFSLASFGLAGIAVAQKGEAEVVRSVSTFSVTTGLEYQQISQEFYDASISDTLLFDILETWNLSKDKIEDFIFRTNLRYRVKSPKTSLDLLTNFELSGDRLLGRGEGYYRVGDNYNNIRLYGKFEGKTTQDDPDDANQGYNFAQGWLKGTRRLASSVTIWGRVGFEQIGFEDFAEVVVDSSDSNLTTFPSGYYNFDYSIRTGRVGGSFALTDFSQRLDWRAEYSHRQVPDSVEANYDQYLFGLDYSYLGMSNYISLEAEGALKDYPQPGGGRDFYSFNSILRGKSVLNPRFNLATTLQIYSYRYRMPDLIYNNYTLLRGELSAPINIIGCEAGPLVRTEYRIEAETESYSEQYRQWELGLVADYFSLGSIGKTGGGGGGGGGGSIIFSGEVTYGKRNYSFGGDILSSYQFISTSVMVGCSISEHLRVDFLFDGSFETHDKQIDDSDLYLLSIGVSSRF